MKYSPLLLSLWITALLLPIAAGADVVISEFMASNVSTLTDDFGESSDWIEVYNRGVASVSLLDWSLTDNQGNPDKWRFPDVDLPAGDHMIVFASDRDRRNPEETLHTNFKLSAGGEYLALVRPDGSIATEYAPEYSGQLPDVSFGLGLLTTSSNLVPVGAEARFLVPSVANGGSTLNGSWTGASTNEPFNTAAWQSGPLGGGFSAGDPLIAPSSMVVRFNFDAAPVADTIVDSKPLGARHDGVNIGATWAATSTDTAGSPVTREGVMQFSSGDPDQITLAADPDFNSTTGTISFWLRTAGVTGGGNEGAMILDRRSSSPRLGDVIVLHDNGTVFVQSNGSSGGANSFESATSIDDDRWHHVAYVYDQDASGSVSIYIDGVLDATQGNSLEWAWPASQQIELGKSHDGYWRALNGAMDDLRIYDRMLTAAEITQIAAGDGGVDPADIGTNLQAPMYDINASAFVRVPFTVADPDGLTQLNLNIKYDDGFVAWINGVEVARANAPASPAWDSAADGVHPSTLTETFVIGNLEEVLVPGTNILAIQGLNVSDKNPSFLVSPELTGVTLGSWSLNGMYFTTPTPGALNLGGVADPGPIIQQTKHTPNIPSDTEDLLVTAQILPTFYPVSTVTLQYRVMFGTEVPVAMNDTGTDGDLLAGDGIWSASIPAGAGSVGQMVRYYITAIDDQANSSRWPLYTDPAGSAEYLGTVIEPDYVTSRIPVLHLFAPSNVLQPGPTTSRTGADSKSGGRVSAYFDGEFYDNIFMRLRGNTTANYNKKSHRLHFNREHPFRHAGGGDRLRKTSFTADYPDPAYMRQGLSFWLCDEIGASGPFYEPYRLQLNGAFYQLANHNDLHGEELLERLGYDPDGALYNAAGMIVPSGASTGGFDKKTRNWEGNADYVEFANAVSESLSTQQRAVNLFDRVDLPQVINYLVAARFAHENDDVWANMSVYHDNDGDDLWRVIPFDMNLSWGAAYVDISALRGIQVDNDDLKSHPLYGSSYTPWVSGGNWNRLYDAIFEVPQTREMFLRRMRTVLDTWVKPPGTPAGELPIEAKVLAWRDLIAEEAANDRAWWGWPGQGGQCNFEPGIDLEDGVDALLNDFLALRREHFYGKHSIANTTLPVGITKTDNAGIPLAQPGNAIVSIIDWDYNPASGNQDEEYICLTNANPYAVDISGWELAGGVEHTMQPGTVIPAGAALYLTPRSRAFRDRAMAPHGGMGLFVQGGYEGHLNAWGETLTLHDDAGRHISSNSYAGTPSTAQRFLRVTEIMYNPPPAPAITSDEQQLEYIELLNTSAADTLDLTGCHFTDGVLFDFTGSAVTSLAPGERVLVVRNATAFEALHGADLPVAGEFSGALDNRGETLRLNDVHGEKILEFTYNNAWHRATDGLGFALVIEDDLVPWFDWDERANWRPGGVLGGSPGVPDTAPSIAPIQINEVLAHTDLPDVDSIELYNPTPTEVDLGGWYLTDDLAEPTKYRIANGSTIAGNGYEVFDAGHFGSAFLLSESGESAWLFSGESSGTDLTGYATGQTFPASPNGVSFGRHITSETNEHFVLQSAQSLGMTNALPRVGPVVISEIMYHPPDLADGSDDALNEFVELENITGADVPLYCVFTNEPGYGAAALTNTWRLRDAVDFDFPTDQVLEARGRLLVVGFDPVADAAQLAAFRVRYAVPVAVPVFGPWQGKLDNSKDTLELHYPDKPDLDGGLFIPFVMMDKVTYKDSPPWATSADGMGDSLQRRASTAYGNDPANWAAVGSTAGTTNSLNLRPSVTLTAPPDGAVFDLTPPITLSATADDADGTVVSVEFRAGTSLLATITSPPYTWDWANPPIGVHALTATAADNQGAISTTEPVRISVVSLPPTVTLTSPSDGASTESGSVVSLAATATDPDTALVGVDFYVDGVLLGTDTIAPYTWTWVATTPVSHTLSAIARDESGSSPASSVTLDVTPRPGVFDDAFASRGSITGHTHSVSGNNSAYTSETGEPNPPVGNTAHSGWLQWTAPASGVCTIDTDGSDFDTVLVVYTSDPPGNPTLGSLTVVVYDDDGGQSRQSKVTFTAVAGTFYQVAVYGYGASDSGDISLQVDLQAFPVITLPPQSQTVPSSTDATFSVTAEGASPLSYQWRFNGANISGATAADFTITGVQASDAGTYTVLVSNPVGSTESAAATLTVQAAPAPPSITAQPQNQTVTVGSDATFTVSADGTSPLAYQWHRDGAAIPGAAADGLTLNDVQFADGGDYSVVVTNSLGSVTSSVATLSVTWPPVTTTLFETNSVWSYLDTGVYPGAEWADPAFDDSAWSSGPGKLGFKTPGNAGFATVLSYGPDSGNKYTTYYFRRQFDISSLEGVLSLTADILRDDGVVLYLNGAEVFRNNLPEAPGHLQLATNCSDNGTVLQTASIPISALEVGLNTLAAEVHQSSLHSSDLVFDARLEMLTAPQPPLITTQPQGRTVTEGSNATFSVTAGGTPPLSYQWRFDGSDIPGATAEDFTITGVRLSDAGNYTVLVSNLVGSTESAAAVLTVQPAPEPPSITAQPQGRTVTEGSNVTFSVTAEGDSPLSYQWRFDGTDIPGATAEDFTITGVRLSDAGNYTVLVSNLVGSTESAAAVLTVQPAPEPPSITTQPQGRTVTEGSNVTFLVTAEGDSPLSYQWRFDGTDIPGATAEDFTITGVRLSDAGNYTVLVGNLVGSTESAAAVLTVQPVPEPSAVVLTSFVFDPSSDGVAFDFTAEAGVSYTVQHTETLAATNWQVWAQIPAATSNRTLTVTNAPPLAPKRFFRVIAAPVL